jgi:FixJ family two-component response regulator
VPTPTIISVIDDDASVRAATENLLRSQGHVVHIFASAEEFLRSAHFDEISCVIADVQMPGMSGAELQSLMLAQGRAVPFIFISGFPDEAVRGRVLEAGAIGFLTKPFDTQTLTRCLGAALAGYSG